MRSGVLRGDYWITKAKGVRLDDEVRCAEWHHTEKFWYSGPICRVFGIERQGGVFVLQLMPQDGIEPIERRFKPDDYLELESRASQETKPPKKVPKKKKGQQSLF